MSIKLEAGTVMPYEYDWKNQFSFEGVYEPFIKMDVGKVRGMAIALEEKEKEIQRLVGFVDEMIEVAFDGADTDGWAIQESAENHGLLVPQKRTEPCGENCRCIDYVFPVVCFRKTYKP